MVRSRYLAVVLLLTAGLLVAADDAASAKRLDEALVKLKTYEMGQSRKPLVAIEDVVREAAGSPALRTAAEERFIAVLRGEATFEGKQFVCQRISEIGTELSVSVLSKLLVDEKLSNTARFALQRIQSPKAGEALRSALGSLGGGLKVGVINSLAERRDREAVPELGKLAGDADAAVAAAAIAALGEIGGQEAAKRLQELTVPDGLKTRRADALLRCADEMCAAGETAAALAIYQELVAKGNPPTTRIGALDGIVRAEKDKALPTLLAFLKEEDPTLRRAAAKFAEQIPGEAATRSLAAELPALPTDTQIVLLTALSARGDKAAAPAVAKLTESADEAVRVAALRALGALGDASHVVLLAKAAAAGGRPGTAAAESLTRLTGDNVGAAMAKAMKGAEPGVRVALIRALLARDYDQMVPTMFDAMADYEPSVFKAACKALASAAGKADLSKMVGLLVQSDNATARRNLTQAIAAAALRIADPGACADPVVAALGKAGDEAKVSLLAILNRIGGPTALAAIRSQLTSANAAVKKAAVQALAEWPDASPMADLLAIAKNEGDEVQQVIALRGYIQQVTMLSKRPFGETVKMLGEAMALAKRPDEEKAILAALINYPCPAAADLAKSCLNDEQIAAEAELAYKKLQRKEGQKFDFQSGNAPVMEGCIEVNASTLYDEQRGYGWLKKPYAERDRKKGTKLTRDFIFDREPRTFRVKVSKGHHIVTVFLGDMTTQHDLMEVRAEGQPGLQKITSKRGEVQELFFDVHVEDGILDVEFRDGGGKDPNWTCAGLIVGK